MLRRMMVRFGSEDSRARTMLAAGPSAQRAKLQRSGDGSGSLELQEAFDRAWRRVGLALDRVGFTVEDRDRSQGLYYVRYVDPEADNKTKKEERGWISKVLLFWKSDEPKGAAVPTGAQYRVHVKGAEANSTVQVLTREGGQDKSESAKKILGLLYDQLK